MEIQVVSQPEHKPRQSRDGEGNVGEFVGAVVMNCLHVPVNVLLDALADGEHVVLGVQVNFQGGLVGGAVRPGLEDHEADAEVVPLVHLPVHDEIVHLGILQCRLVVGGDQDAHVGHPVTLPPFLADEGLHDLFVYRVAGPVHGVEALWHDIGQGLHDGGKLLDPCSVCSHTVSPCSF